MYCSLKERKYMNMNVGKKLDDDLMKSVSGGKLETSTDCSADEIVHYDSARTTCPLCGGSALVTKIFLMHDHTMCRMGQTCQNPSCRGYSWTYGPKLKSRG